MTHSKYAKIAVGAAALLVVAATAYALGARRVPSASMPVPVLAPAPAPVPTPVAKGRCVVGGCSRELCTDDSQGPIMSPCIYRPENICYKTAVCERQPSGECGWTPTAALGACLKNPPSLSSNLVFDTLSAVPNTSVQFTYPKEGFFGHGVSKLPYDKEVFVYNVIGGIGLRPENFKASRPNEYPDVSVAVFRLEEGKTLEEVIAHLEDSQFPNLSKQGAYSTVNGHRYFISQSLEGNVYTAYALGKDGLIRVMLVGGFDENERGAIPDLFIQILSHVKFS